MGIEKAGGQVDLLQIKETLSGAILEKMSAPPKPTDPVIDGPDALEKYDAFLLGIPTRWVPPSTSPTSPMSLDLG